MRDEAIRALIVKWREQARLFHQYNDNERNEDAKAGFNLCADELEAAALAQPARQPSALLGRIHQCLEVVDWSEDVEAQRAVVRAVLMDVVAALAQETPALEMPNPRQPLTLDDEPDFPNTFTPRAGSPETPRWQPIATAPKDGTKVLAWDGFDCGVFAWCGDIAGWNARELCMEEPTHWMPLPSPPEGAR